MTDRPAHKNWQLTEWAGAGPRRVVSAGMFGDALRWLRIGLPVLAVIVIVVVLVWPVLFNRAGFRIGGAPVASGNGAYAKMNNPQFTGVDNRDQYYTVTAASATQRRAGEEIFELEAAKADWSLNDGGWMAVTSEGGRFDKKQKQLNLQGHVTLFQDRGYELITDTASVDLASGNANGTSPVQGQGPAGTIESEGFQLLDKGATVIFTGQTKMLLFDDGKEPPPAKEPSEPKGPKP